MKLIAFTLIHDKIQITTRLKNWSEMKDNKYTTGISKNQQENENPQDAEKGFQTSAL